MKALIASLTALGLIATTPALAQTTNNTMSNKTTTKAMPAKKSVAKEAKTEGESVGTEAKEHKTAARHHRHHKKHMAKKHMAKKTTKTTSTTTTKTPG